ncbi:MAG TPA: alpha-ketoglutarate-dependent dioxygenase AlkB [Nocardioidaceae bacterium]|nr:alpha-ketoglutarate-dependent dioxygenase AlkB [Nocardioidaceae bacterium]
MTVDFQESLFDGMPVSGAETSAGPGPAAGPALGDLGRQVRRHQLSHGAWVDACPGWVSGSADLFAKLVRTVPWHAERREMYERVVDVPRLLKFYGEGQTLPDALLERARAALSDHYRAELGEDFTTAGLCYYRDGRDSVAWHGDTIGRSRTEDTMVAIVSFGEPRRLSLRPRQGVPGADGDRQRRLEFLLGHGDLVVMGGSCQRTWEHAILKTSRPVGPRISVQFRPRGVR